MTFYDLTIYNDNPLLIRLCTELDLLPNFERFPQNICDGCGMPTGEVYSSGHMVPFGLAYVFLVETNPFSKLVIISTDCALRISLGTFASLLPVKFRWIPFRSFRGEVENVSAKQRSGRPSCFSDRPKNRKRGRGLWDLASCQFSLNSVQRFERRSQICISKSEARAEILFSDRPEKHKLYWGRWYLVSFQVWVNSVERFQRRSRKCFSQSAARAAILFFRLAGKLQTFVENVKIYLSVKFRWIPFKGFRGDLVCLSHSKAAILFSDQPKNINFVKGVDILLPAMLRWILFSGYRAKVKMSQLIRAHGGHLVFPTGPKTTHLV